MKMIHTIMLSAVLMSCMALPAVHAEDKPKGPGEQMGRMKIFSQLNLTEDQRKQIEANKQKQKDLRKSSFDQMKSQREALHQELMKSELDMNKVNSINEQLKNLEAQMRDGRLQSILEVRRILTPEQFSKFIALMKEQRSQWKHKGSKDEKSK